MLTNKSCWDNFSLNSIPAFSSHCCSFHSFLLHPSYWGLQQQKSVIFEHIFLSHNMLLLSCSYCRVAYKCLRQRSTVESNSCVYWFSVQGQLSDIIFLKLLCTYHGVKTLLVIRSFHQLLPTNCPQIWPYLLYLQGPFYWPLHSYLLVYNKKV